jgi:hypothetical protein
MTFSHAAANLASILTTNLLEDGPYGRAHFRRSFPRFDPDEYDELKKLS